MQWEKWQQIKGQIQDAFSDAVIEKETLPEPEKGSKEMVFFTGPLGKMKLELITRPVVLDKVTHGSRRIGSEAAVEYIYSDEEFTHQLKIFRQDLESGEWVEMESQRDGFSL